MNASASFSGDRSHGPQIGQITGGILNFHLDSSSQVSGPPPIADTTPNLLSYRFLSRTEELEEIRSAFALDYGDRPARCVIHGMPGLGKTQLALKFATQAFENKIYSYVLWVSASSSETIYRDLTKLSETLNLPGHPGQDEHSRKTQIRLWLERTKEHKRWLIVLDSVDIATVQLAEDIIPNTNKHGNVLFTARAWTVAERLATAYGSKHKRIGLQTLPIHDAIMLLFNGDEFEQEETSLDKAIAEKIVAAVGCLPLAIDQASSYLSRSGSTAQELLAIYAIKDDTEIFEWENDLSKYEQRSVMATFVSTFDKLEHSSADATLLFRVCAFLDPGNISLQMLKTGAEGLKESDWQANVKAERAASMLASPVRLNQALQMLEKLSLASVRKKPTGQVLWIHDLVQLLIRKKTMSIPFFEQYLKVAILLVSKAVGTLRNVQDWDTWRSREEYMPHILSLDRNASLAGIRSMEFVEACYNTSRYLYYSNRYEEAEFLSESTLRSISDLCGTKHEITLAVRRLLASVYVSQHKDAKAQEIAEELVEISKNIDGFEPVQKIKFAELLIRAYSAQHQYKKAIALGEELLPVIRTESETGAREAIWCGSRLIASYIGGRMWENAEQLALERLPVVERVLGKQSEDFVLHCLMLGRIYLKQGRHSEAQHILDGVYMARRERNGKYDRRRLKNEFSLAKLYEELGQYAKALVVVRSAVDTSLKFFGLGVDNIQIIIAKEAAISYKHHEDPECLTRLQTLYRRCVTDLGQEHQFSQTMARWVDEIRRKQEDASVPEQHDTG